MRNSRNLVPTIGLCLVIIFFAMCWIVVGESGSVVGSPSEILGMPGALFLYATILATFANIFIAARRAHRAGSWLWFFSVIFLWPLSYVYTLAINRDS